MTIPQIGLMLCHLAISITDLWVAGKLEGGVLAALGIVSQIHMLLMIVASMVGTGCLALISQALGSGRPYRAKRYAGLIVGLSFISGTAVGILGLCATSLLVSLLGVPLPLISTVNVFMTAYCCQLPFYYCLIMSNSVFRAYKHVWTPFFAMTAVCVVNFIGSMGFGLGLWNLPCLGATGVAWSTFASAVCGLTGNLYLLHHRGILVRLSFAPWRWCRLGLRRLISIGIPATIGNLVGQSGSLIVLGFLTGLGLTEAVSGMTIGTRICSIVLFPVSAFGITLAIFTGHLLGAHQGEQAYFFARRCLWGIFACMLTCCVALWIGHSYCVAFFTDDSLVTEQAKLYMLFACFWLPLQAITSVINGIFSGAGATKLLCFASLIKSWAVLVPLAWILSRPFELGVIGIYSAMFISSIIGTLVMLIFFIRKRWLIHFT